jgi:hypothetical protein
MRVWYDNHAVFIPECDGQELVMKLTEVFSTTPKPVSLSERQQVCERFNWSSIVENFWAFVGARV